MTIFVVLLGTSREAWAQKISIHMNNATLEEVLKKIKKKTKYDMMYQMKDVKEIDSRQSVHFDETATGSPGLLPARTPVRFPHL
ncbi:MAG: hypothetical protein ACLU4J_14995 [Butyricimonas paravirosa]